MSVSNRMTDVFREIHDSDGVFVNSADTAWGEHCKGYWRKGYVTAVSGFSYDGPNADTNFRYLNAHDDSVDFCLPNCCVYYTTESGGTYTSEARGTSAAAPLMAGIYGLMMSYSIHNDRAWTVDSITNRLKAFSTPVELFIDEQLPETFGGFGAGIPDVYRAMTDTGDYHVVTIADPILQIRSNAERYRRGYSAGDTVSLMFTVNSQLSTMYRVRLSAISLDAAFVPLDTSSHDSLLQSVSYRDSVGIVLNSNLDTSVPYTILLLLQDLVGFVDTIPAMSFVPAPAAEVLFVTSEGPIVRPQYVCSGQCDDDSSAEVAFYLGDSLYCFDLMDSSSQFSAKYCAAYAGQGSPAMGDFNGDGMDEILYSPTRYSVGLIDGNGVSLSGWPKSSSDPTCAPPVISDINSDGYLDVVHLQSDALYVYGGSGDTLAGFPIDLPFGCFAEVSDSIPLSPMVVGDLTGDGLPEIAIVTQEAVRIYNDLSDTALYVDTLSVANLDPKILNLKIGDVDGDGYLEMLIPHVMYDYDSSAHLDVIGWSPDSTSFRRSDSLFARFSLFGVDLDYGFLGPSEFAGFDGYALGDIDSDHFPNAVALTYNNRVNAFGDSLRLIAFDTSGTEDILLNQVEYKAMFPQFVVQHAFGTTHGGIVCQPAVGQYDGVGGLDIIYSGDPCKYLFAHTTGGASVPPASNGVMVDYYDQVFADTGDGASTRHRREFGLGSPSLISDRDDTWLGLFDAVINIDSSGQWTRGAALRFWRQDSNSPSQEWPLYRHDRYLTGCYRQPTLGEIQQDIIWRDTVYLYGDLIVPFGKTLSIRPGTVIRSHNHDLKRGGEDTLRAEIIVRGHLEAVGSDTCPIVFESLNGTEGDWYGIVIDSGGSAEIRHAVFHDGYKTIYDKGSAHDTIADCTVNGSELCGIWIRNRNATVSDCIVRDIESGYGIRVDSCVFNTSNGVTLLGDSVVACEHGFYLYKCKGTLTGCAVVGPGSKGVYVWDRAGNGSSNALKLYDLDITGEFSEHVWAYYANLVIDTCDIISNQDSTRSDYGALFCFTSDFTLRDTRIHNHDAAGICTGFSCTSNWDLGSDKSQWGYNSILSNDSSYRAVDASNSGPTFKAERNWWGSRDPDSSLFAIMPPYYVDFQPCLTSNPYPKAGVPETPLVPEQFALHYNYPNPFNPSTTIQFDLPKATHVELVVYNILGQRVATLVDRYYPAGWHSVTWDGRTSSGKEVASGIYLYRIETEYDAASKKMVLVK